MPSKKAKSELDVSSEKIDEGRAASMPPDITTPTRHRPFNQHYLDVPMEGCRGELAGQDGTKPRCNGWAHQDSHHDSIEEAIPEDPEEETADEEDTHEVDNLIYKSSEKLVAEPPIARERRGSGDSRASQRSAGSKTSGSPRGNKKDITPPPTTATPSPTNGSDTNRQHLHRQNSTDSSGASVAIDMVEPKILPPGTTTTPGELHTTNTIQGTANEYEKNNEKANTSHAKQEDQEELRRRPDAQESKAPERPPTSTTSSGNPPEQVKPAKPSNPNIRVYVSPPDTPVSLGEPPFQDETLELLDKGKCPTGSTVDPECANDYVYDFSQNVDVSFTASAFLFSFCSL